MSGAFSGFLRPRLSLEPKHRLEFNRTSAYQEHAAPNTRAPDYCSRVPRLAIAFLETSVLRQIPRQNRSRRVSSDRYWLLPRRPRKRDTLPNLPPCCIFLCGRTWSRLGTEPSRPLRCSRKPSRWGIARLDSRLLVS